MIKKVKSYPHVISISVLALFVLSGCFGVFSNIFAVELESIPEELRLKTDKENIIGSLQRVDSVKYAYKTTNTENLPDEIVEKRTKHSRTFLTDKPNVYKTEIISGEPQYYKDSDGNWWQAEYATTTEEAFLQQTAPTIIEEIVSFFLPSIYAVETESTFYPEGDPETSTVDGYALHQFDNPGSDDWSTVTGAAGNGHSDNDVEDSSLHIRAGTTQNYYRRLSRVFFLFDTSAIPDIDDIFSATLSIYGTNKVDNNSIAPDINIYSSNPASNNDIVNTDYASAHFGSTAFSTAISYASWNTAGYNDFVLNASGIANISKTGISKFGARNANYDVAGNDPGDVGWSEDSFSYLQNYFAERTGTSEDPKLVVVHGAEVAFQNISYTYDNVGNITNITDYSETGAGKVVDFVYDDLYRLTSASTTSATSTPYSETYTYSAIGNITNKSDQGNYTYSETDYASPHAVTDINGTTLTYDQNGNLTNYGSWNYGWDYRNRLTQSGNGTATTTYGYDQNNLRVLKIAENATTTYPNRYQNYNGATTTSHIFLPDGTLVATIEANGEGTTTSYVHADHLGSINVTTDESGAVVEVADYYPFGKQRISQLTSGTAEQRKFTGHEYDSDSDLTYAQQRYYEQDVGKWLSVDSISRDDPRKILTDPQSLNMYSYTRNNPILYIDPK